MERLAQLRKVVVCLMLLLALNATYCNRTESGSEPDTEYTLNNCTSNSECPEGGVCDAELAVCVIDALPDGLTSKNYYLKIQPPESSSLLPQTVELSVRSADQPTVAYTMSTPVEGRINTVRAVWTESGLEIGEQLNARVAFLPSESVNSAIPKLAYVFQTDDNPIGTPVFLSPGRWDLIVKNTEQQLADEYYPDVHLTDIRFTEDGVLLDEDDQELNVIPVPRAPVAVRGTIRRGGLPVNDLVVRALHPVEQDVVSTVDITSCSTEGTNCGQFEIGLRVGVESFALLVSHKRESAYPTVRVSGLSVPSGQEFVDLTNDSRLDFPGLSAPLDCRLQVSRGNPYSADDATSLSTQGASVVFTSDAVGGGEVSLTVGTNESGAIERSRGQTGVYLYPGSYQMAVYPPLVGTNAPADYRVYTAAEPIVVSADQVTADGFIQLDDALLELRAKIHGSVSTPAGVVSAAAVDSTPLGSDPFLRKSQAITDSNGEFGLWYDPSDFGSYYLTIAPPANSGYSWLIWQLEDSPGETVDQIDVDLPLPLKATIQLSAPGYEIEESVVEFYEDIYLAPEPASLVGRGVADADGKVVVLLPPQVFAN